MANIKSSTSISIFRGVGALFGIVGSYIYT